MKIKIKLFLFLCFFFYKYIPKQFRVWKNSIVLCPLSTWCDVRRARFILECMGIFKLIKMII